MMSAVRPFQDIKADFPALAGDTCYLDTAASAQKPQTVIDAMRHVMQNHYANVHRGVYEYSALTSSAFESARRKVAGFIGAASDREIVFTRNTTEAINLVANTWGAQNLRLGDEVILSALEHHANIVPWHILREKNGIVIKVIPLLEDGALDMNAYEALLSEKTKLVAVTHMSNALGTLTPVQDIIAKAKSVGARVLLDGSQGVVHMPVDVQNLGCDFYAFTGHKLYGPTGIGVLWAPYDLLETLPPYQGGGDMIETVTFEKVTYKAPPSRFEAGTPAIVEAVGLGAAIDYLSALPDMRPYEDTLLSAAEDALSSISGITLYSRAPERAAILCFNIDNVHPHDAATILDQAGVAVRAGHHCCQPLMQALGVNADTTCIFWDL